MTSIRRTVSFAAVAAVLALGAVSTAQAGYKDRYTPHPTGLPSVTSNTVVANNIAAGIGNKANQHVFADQSGAATKWPGYGGGFTANSTNATNLAAGIGNKANQDVMTRQSGGPGITLNRVDAMNLAAGEHNFANQQVMADQR